MAELQQQQQEEQQQHPPTEQPPDVTQHSGDTGMRKMAAKEDLAFLTSGAKEKMDKTLAGMKGAAHIMTHPFNKEAKEEATAQTIQKKDEIADKHERIRATAHMQLLQDKAAADGFDFRDGSPTPITEAQQREDGEAGYAPAPAPAPDAQQLESDVAAASGRDANVDSGEQEAGNRVGKESDNSARGDKMLEDSSDESGRGRGRTLAQISPDSQDYQSG